MLGMARTFTATITEVAEVPAELVTLQDRFRVPTSPALKVIVFVDPPKVTVPPVIDQE